ncbi:hypothetical protein O3P69_018606 [Scylla paramamosain]|uniref:Uncharacterized protein n=1 Tax=Scylla paramamosain TaxID=85552 RepID=A0AAW0T3S7_SCYPA
MRARGVLQARQKLEPPPPREGTIASSALTEPRVTTESPTRQHVNTQATPTYLSAWITQEGCQHSSVHRLPAAASPAVQTRRRSSLTAVHGLQHLGSTSLSATRHAAALREPRTVTPRGGASREHRGHSTMRLVQPGGGGGSGGGASYRWGGILSVLQVGRRFPTIGHRLGDTAR